MNKSNNKKRLYEVFEKVNGINLKEWYDDDYFGGMDVIKDFNPENLKDVKELFTLLTIDGIEDMKDHYPVWLFNMLNDNGYIEEDKESFLWFFSKEGKERFNTPEDLQKFLLDKSYGSRGGESETPFLRGREPMSE